MPVIEPNIDDYERGDINEHIARPLRDLGNPEPPLRLEVVRELQKLDLTDPKTAIIAMQSMNTSVRNAMFFPAFFLTLVILAMTAFSAHNLGRSRFALLFGSGAAIYVCGAFETVNIHQNAHRAPEFLAVNPSGKVPVLVDATVAGGGIRTSESGAILLYLAEKSGFGLADKPQKSCDKPKLLR